MLCNSSLQHDKWYDEAAALVEQEAAKGLIKYLFKRLIIMYAIAAKSKTAPAELSEVRN